jgi:hypothetical protein
VSDLSPLKETPLTRLSCSLTPVADLAPLKDLKLTFLACAETRVADLSPLVGMPLAFLSCARSPVPSLSPLAGMPLDYLDCAGTKVSDLSPLRGMNLTTLYCDYTRVGDLSALKGMPLKRLHCNFDPKRDAGILRSLPTLETVNDRPAAEVLRDATSDGSDLVGTWRTDHDGLTEEVRITRTRAGVWEVKGSYLRQAKQVGSWVGVRPRFADGKLTVAAGGLVKPTESWTGGDAELWTYKDQLQAAFTPPGGGRGYLAYTRAAK